MTTLRQEEVFGFVRDYFDKHGFAPTLDEIGTHFGFSPVAALKHVHALIAQKKLARRKGARGLVIPGWIDLLSVPTSALEAELARRQAEPAICGECGARPHEPAARSCTRPDCPLAKPAERPMDKAA